MMNIKNLVMIIYAKNKKNKIIILNVKIMIKIIMKQNTVIIKNNNYNKMRMIITIIVIIKI